MIFEQLNKTKVALKSILSEMHCNVCTVGANELELQMLEANSLLLNVSGLAIAQFHRDAHCNLSFYDYFHNMHIHAKCLTLHSGPYIWDSEFLLKQKIFSNLEYPTILYIFCDEFAQLTLLIFSQN